MRNQELNLLMVFDAIMTEGSITRAAERLSMTQPAVSNAVSRMRVAWKDELFVKDGRNIQPTLHAKNLWAQIRSPLKQLSEAVDPTAFDPATASRTFRIAASDVIVDFSWKQLRRLVEEQAPGVNIYGFPYTITNGEQLLNDAEVDLVVAPAGMPTGPITSEYLFGGWYVCVMRPDHPLAKADLSLEEFVGADHLLVSLSGDTVGLTDQVLMQHGLKRRIAMTVNHFTAVAPILKDSDLIAVVPSSGVEASIFSGELAVTHLPFDMPPTQISCFWHKRQENDAGLSWFREQFCRILKEKVEAHHRELERRFCGCEKACG